jgi:hypothetical protein
MLFFRPLSRGAIMVVAISAHSIAYMALPKAACSSVKTALSSIDPDIIIPQEELRRNGDIIHKFYPTRRFRPHRWEHYDGWWRFAVVRDPLARLLSVYTDRVIGRQELKASRRLRQVKHLSVDPDPDFFFQNIQSYKKLASAVKHHALPARLFIGPRPLRYDAVYRVNELPALSKKLSEITGHPVSIPRLNRSRAKLNFDDLARPTQDILRDLLAQEYEDLQDYFENPML